MLLEYGVGYAFLSSCYYSLCPVTISYTQKGKFKIKFMLNFKNLYIIT